MLRRMPPLPRFGMAVPLPRRFATLLWHGLGPHETYSDRTSGARVGVYNQSVSSQVL